MHSGRCFNRLEKVALILLTNFHHEPMLLKLIINKKYLFFFKIGLDKKGSGLCYMSLGKE